MTIEVRLHPYVRQSIPASQKLAREGTWVMSEGTTVDQVAAILNLPKGFPVILTVNGSACYDWGRTVLKEKDTVLVSPVMAGG